MNIDPWILSFSAITVIATVAMGFWSARRSKTASDFFVAGRSVSVGWNASAISGEYLSAASFMGVAGMVMSSGYDALWYPVCYACGYLFLLLFIAGPLRRFGAYTIPDFAEGRYDSPLFRKIAVIFVLFIGFFYTMPQMKGAGTTLAYIFPGLPYWVGVALVGAVITLNVALGGMKGITLVQAVQYWAKMFAISVPIFVLMSVYGDYGKQLAVNDIASSGSGGLGMKLVLAYSPPLIANEETRAKLRSIVEMVPSANLSKLGLGQTGTWWPEKKFYSEASLVGLRFPLPTLAEGDELKSAPVKANALNHIYLSKGIIGYIEGKKEVICVPASLYPEAKRAFELRGLVGLTDATPLIVPNALNETDHPKGTLRKPLPEKAPADQKWISPFGPLTTKAAAKAGLNAEQQKPFSLLYTYSLIIALVCGTAGLPHILVRFYTNPDGVAAKRTTMWVMILIGIFYVFPPVFGVMGRNLMPELYNGLTGVKGTDGIVLKLPKLLNDRFGVLGSILSGVTCAGAFAAFMSTFSGLLVSMTGALAHDVYGRIFRPKSTADQRMRMFKICAVICGAGAILLGFFVKEFEINKMVGWAFAIAAASYFPLLFMSVWWRGMTMRGAATGMLAGGMASLITVVSTMLADQAAWAKPLSDFFASRPLLRILCEQPAIWAVPLAIALMIVVSKLTRNDIPPDVRMKMLVLHAPEKLGLKQEYIQEHQSGH